MSQKWDILVVVVDLSAPGVTNVTKVGHFGSELLRVAWRRRKSTGQVGQVGQVGVGQVDLSAPQVGQMSHPELCHLVVGSIFLGP
eukprot:gene25997-biopygen12742